VTNFQETDYGNFLQDEEDPSAAVDPRSIEPKCMQKASDEFRHLRADTVEPLSTFLDYCTHEYMIQQVLEILQLTAHRHTMSEEEFKEQLDEILHVRSHPLGRFDESLAKSITAFGTSEAEIRDLYASVLVETPVGRYFERYFLDEAEGAGGAAVRGTEVDATLVDQPMARLEHGVMRLWLEEFYDFCDTVGGETAVVMKEILEARAAAITISVTYNSLRAEFAAAAVRAEFRKACFPRFGPLYPDGGDALAAVATPDDLGRALTPWRDFARLWSLAPEDENGDRRIHDIFVRKDIYLLQNAFDGQAHYACFYAYLKLKEVEARNLGWIARQVRLRSRDFARIIIPFSRETPIGPAATGATPT
jgi:V-type H+-transporting ATPase subunit d